MARVWKSYISDGSRIYPIFGLSVRQLNDVPSDTNPVELLPKSIRNQLIEVKYPCGVQGLTPRYLILCASDGGQFQLSYPQPFTQNLYDFLTLNTNVAAFEFVGERLKYGRLKRMLDNVRS